MSEEGIKVDAAQLGESEGEKIEKPILEKQKGESETGTAQPGNMLAKDW